MEQKPFDLHRPDVPTTSVVFASPHSGRDYPDELLRESTLAPAILRSSEDAFVDRLLMHAPETGAPLLCARLPRAWLDLNRAPGELDPALIKGLGRGPHNPRVASGLGVVPRVVSGGRPIYEGKIALATAEERIRDAWHPYHRTLRELVSDARNRFGEAILIDCHSMPHEALEHLSGKRPDIVLGDRFGAAASVEIVDRLQTIFTDLGLSCARNVPFAGAYIAQHYGRPAKGQHAVQIEIDRALYMDEVRIEPHQGFDAFKSVMDNAIEAITEIGRHRTQSLAAE
ncbi:N-formylglutamate amidohydrolase [Palleronia sp. LCG004]|uniref:N-formylglutamate amidohydrolase n=1 Tax=Palleronia sp. LCG004 TaxID=3079304 RepID=UPI00294256D9|nr:N-formylglutamate amidohydrolase [Palleronia sp. LCG004]WOI55464.1 N-formylglutamate amidohydrolase [Palleronia sp. LCG004]